MIAKVSPVSYANVKNIMGVSLASISSYIGVQAEAAVELSLATAPANSETVDMWVSGSGSATIQWRSGDTQGITLTSTPTKYSNTFSNETADIRITVAPSSLSTLTISATNDFTITTTNLNTFTGLTSFVNIGSEITGSIATLDMANLTTLNLGDQTNNTALTGDLGTLLTNKLLTTLYLKGGNLTYSDQSYSGLPENFSYRLEDTGFTNAEVDAMVIDVDAANTSGYSGTLSIIGENNGYRTSTSDAAFTSLQSDSVTLEFNGIPLGSMSFTNTSQAYENGTTITSMVPTVLDENSNTVSTDITYESFSLPSFMSLSASTGTISANGNAVTGSYDFVIRVIGNDTYTGYVDVEFHIIVDDGTAPTASNPTVANVTDTQADIGFDTDEAHQTAYYVITQSATAPSATQVKNAQDHLGGTPDASGNQTITATGTQTFPTVTTLSAGNTYYGHMIAEDVNSNLSNVVTTASFTTQVPQPRVFLVNIYGGTSSRQATEVNDPEGKYWNNLDYNVGSISNIVETDNTSSSISVTISGTTGGGDFNGHNADTENYASEMWDSERSVTTTVMTISITGLDSGKTYDIKIFASRTGGSRTGKYKANDDVTVSTDLTIDASPSPPASGTISTITPGSGTAAADEIFIEATQNTSGHTAHFNGIEITESV